MKVFAGVFDHTIKLAPDLPWEQWAKDYEKIAPNIGFPMNFGNVPMMIREKLMTDPKLPGVLLDAAAFEWAIQSVAQGSEQTPRIPKSEGDRVTMAPWVRLLKCRYDVLSWYRSKFEVAPVRKMVLAAISFDPSTNKEVVLEIAESTAYVLDDLIEEPQLWGQVVESCADPETRVAIQLMARKNFLVTV